MKVREAIYLTVNSITNTYGETVDGILSVIRRKWVNYISAMFSYGQYKN